MKLDQIACVAGNDPMDHFEYGAPPPPTPTMGASQHHISLCFSLPPGFSPLCEHLPISFCLSASLSMSLYL